MIDPTPAIAVAALTLGAYQDWKGRQVTNRTWTISLIIASPFLMAEAWTNPIAAAWRWTTAILVAAFAFMLWRIKQMGAGDSKGITTAGLLMTPYGYYDPSAASFVPILDALLAGLLITEAWRRIGKTQGTPFLVVLAPLAFGTLFWGGLLWWPFVWLSVAFT